LSCDTIAESSGVEAFEHAVDVGLPCHIKTHGPKRSLALLILSDRLVPAMPGSAIKRSNLKTDKNSNSKARNK
jgi:hypothetical protein